jgi:hypothetical protein
MTFLITTLTQLILVMRGAIKQNRPGMEQKSLE